MSTNADGNSPTPEVDEAEPQALEQPEPKPDPKSTKSKGTKAQAKPAPESKTTEPEAKGRAPWEDDLYGRGLDDPRFHEYMRDVQQPYVTKMEQQVAQYRGAFGDDPEALEAAAHIFYELAADPEQHPGVAEDAVRKLVDVLGLDPDVLFPLDGEPGAEGEPGVEADGMEPGQDPPQEDDPRLKWADAKMREEQETAESEWYNGVIAKLKEGIPGFNEKLFHKMVLATQGDLEAALDLYEEHHVTPEPKPPAPPTHGSGGGIPPATAKRYDSFDEAIDDFMDEIRTARA